MPILIWLLGWSLASQLMHGYTPIGGRFQYVKPDVTDHHRLLDRFAGQIPEGAALATFASLYPHLSHREAIYRFPILADATYVLIDAAAQSGWTRHPQEIRDQIAAMLGSGQWAVQDASDGYLLLRADPEARPTTIADLPAEFFTFAKSADSPQVPLDIGFAPPGSEEVRLKLLGYDVIDRPQWRETAFRFYWQIPPGVKAKLPPELNLRAFFLTPDGREVDSTDLRPLMQSFWYPPDRWQPGETVITDKLPWFMPREYAIAMGVTQSADWEDQASRWRVVKATPTAVQPPQSFENNTWIRTGTVSYTHLRAHET